MNNWFEIIERVLKLKEFAPETVGKVLGVKLNRRSDANPFFLYYEAKMTGGPFSKAELQIPGPNATSQDRRLNLDVALGVEVTREEVVRRYGSGSIYQIIPEAAPEGRIIYAYPQREQQKLFFEFTGKTLKLLGVTICRGRCD